MTYQPNVYLHEKYNKSLYNSQNIVIITFAQDLKFGDNRNIAFHLFSFQKIFI